MGAFNSWLISNLMWEALKASSSGVLRSATRARPVKGWAGSLNDKFFGEFRVLRETCREPVIHSDGEYPLNDTFKKEARRLAKINSKKDRPNDQHGILSRQPNWLSDPVNLHIQSLDFGAVSALRAEGQRPEILSASAVIVCSARRQILLQSRARDLATYPGCIHTVGDAYIPPGFGTVDSDRGGLVSTLTREVNEETQLSLSMESLPNLMISKELTTGFIQLVFLGVGMGASAMDRIIANWEGSPECISYDDLPALLTQKNWVPSGKAHVLAWLAFGAPNAGVMPRFGGTSPKKLFQDTLAAM